jgi:putative transposase
MPRPPRLDLPGIPQHIVQRGNNRLPCFFGDNDYLGFRSDLREIAFSLGVAIHAYVLMTNHVHLLATPPVPGAISQMMQKLGRRYVRRINDTYGRTGTLWEGRFKSCLIDSEEYALTCYRYIELNPVRAAMVESPDRYPWSSYGCNADLADDPVVTPHASYLALAPTAGLRSQAYPELVACAITDDDLASIRQYLQLQQALGSSRFQDAIERQVARRARPGIPGRPAGSSRER